MPQTRDTMMIETADYSSEGETPEKEDYASVNAGADVHGANGELSFAIPEAFYDGTKNAIASDTNLIAANIAYGKTIFGITGTEDYPPFRYFAFKIYSNWGDASYMALRRLVLLTSVPPIVTPAYPPAQNDTYVKATTKQSTSYWPYFCTDPAKSLIGTAVNNAWVAGAGSTHNRFHIDAGASIVLRGLYYENYHESGGLLTRGAKHFALWGSNDSTAFANLTYETDTNWTPLKTGQSIFDQHIASDTVNPKYMTVTQ